MTESIHYGIKLNLKNVTEARKYLTQFKDMSLVIRVNDNIQHKLLTKAIFKMHGMKNIKLINGLENPRTYHFKRGES